MPRRPANGQRSAAVGRKAPPALGDLPDWNLADLYPAMDAPGTEARPRAGRDRCACLREPWKGKLAAEAGQGRGRPGSANALREYEALDELIGRIGSYAGLVYAGNTTDPQRAKLYGDVQEKMTDASAHLLFFALELNLVDDALIGAALDADPAFGHYRPWVLDLRKDKPYQLDDRIEQLFHEKSITGRGAWNRLFDETMADLRFDIDGEQLTLEPALNRLQDADPETRRQAAEALAATFKKNIRIFTLITNTLAKDKEISDRWRGFQDIADSRHLANRVERSVVDALASRRARGLSAPVAPLLRDEGEMARHGDAQPLGPQRAAARNAAGDDRLGRGAATPCCRPMAASRPRWRRSPGTSSTATGSTRRCGPARRPAHSRIRPCRRRIPMCCSTTWASRAT